MKKQYVLMCLIFIVLGVGCKKEGNHILLTISDTPNYSVEFGEEPGEIEITTFLIAKEEGVNVEQNLNLAAIEGFSYEKGYEYLLKVKKANNSKTDDSQYSLVEIVSKNQTGELEEIVLLNAAIVRFEDPELPSYERVVAKEIEIDPPQWGLPSGFKIDGFECEKGFDYLLKVKKTTIKMPPQSGFLNFYLYTLVEIISKTPQE